MERSHAERHPKEPRMVAVVTLTDVAGARYAITLSTADLISLREVLGILFSADQNTVAQGWSELIAGQ